MDYLPPEDKAGSCASRSDRGEPARPLTGPGLSAGLVSLPLAGDPGYDAAPLLNAANTTGGVRLSWNALPGAPGYKLYRRGGSGGWIWLAASRETRCIDASAVPGSTYTYCLAAASADGQSLLSPMSPEESITFIPYDAPAIRLSSTWGGVQIQWNAVSGAPRYNLYRRVGSGGWAWLGASTGSSYVDHRAVSSISCAYRMAVVTADGKALLSPMSPEESITWLPVLSFTLADTPRGVRIAWSALSGAPRYNLYRKSGFGDWTWLAGTAGTSYVDSTATPGMIYSYRMAVVSADGKSLLSPLSAEKSLTR